MSLDAEWAPARSGTPSRLKSPTAVDRGSACREDERRLEGAIAGPEQDPNGIETGTGHREVEHPVTVEVAHGHVFRIGAARGKGHRRLKGAIAIAQQH